MSELDWIIEHEELPGDEPYSPAPESQPPQRRRIPTWAWLISGFLAVAIVALIILWTLGGEDVPSPAPQPELASLEAAVVLEIGALNSGDREIYDRQQDVQSYRRNFSPPPEVWFGAGEPPGQFELIDVRPLGAAAGRADVRIEWNGTAYRLVWFYRQAGDRWLHTDWAPGQLTTTVSLTTTHLVVEHHPEVAREAVALAERTEELITGLCSLLTCVDEPISLTIALDALYTSPTVDENGDTLRLPSPLRLRWPVNGEPEPLVMGSLGRHLAERLVIPPATADLQGNRDALRLIAFWLAHDLLELEPLPGTAWLDEVEAREGRAAVAALAEGIRTGIAPQEAVRQFLRAETVAAVTERPDYMTWLALIADSVRLLRGFDEAADPWAPAGRSYSGIYPELVDVIYQDGWAVAVTAPESSGPVAVFFQLRAGNWNIVQTPDESLIGERRERVEGPFEVVYYEWDEPYINQVLEMLTETHEKVAANFGLTERWTYQVMVMPYPEFPGSGFELAIQWPRLSAWRGEPAVSDQALLIAAGLVMGRYQELSNVEEDRILMLLGLFLWQLEELGVSPERWYGMIDFVEAEDWRPPATVNDAGWLPLTECWHAPTGEPSVDAMAQYLWTPYLLTTYIVETFGHETVRLMSDGLSKATSMGEWIDMVTGQPLEDLELAWREWVIARWREGSG